jgi:hypothetical protein
MAYKTANPKISPQMLAILQARDPATLTVATTRPASENVVDQQGRPISRGLSPKILLVGAAGLVGFLFWRRSHR